MTLSVNFSISRFRNLLTILILVLVGLHLLFQYLRFFTPYTDLVLIKRFNLDEEISIPTWFSQIELALAASSFALIGYLQSPKKVSSKPWWGLAAIFLYLSIDEGSMLHEGLITPLRTTFEVSNTAFGFAWVLVGIPFVAILALIYAKFLFSLPTHFKKSLLLAACIYVGGALGVEMIGAYYLAQGGSELGYTAIITLEETMQMTGIAILIIAQLRYLQTNTTTLQFELNS